METDIKCPYCGEVNSWERLDSIAMPDNNPNSVKCWLCDHHFNVNIYVETEKLDENE